MGQRIIRYTSTALIGLMLITLLIVAPIPQFKVYAQQPAESLYVDVTKYIRREPWMKPGGIVRVPMMGEANTLNPFTLTTSWEFMIIDLVYDTLVIVTPDLKYAGRLAKSWSVSPDGLTWTFKLYENATWHNGDPVTAEDVVYTFNLLKKFAKVTRFSTLAPLIESVKAIDTHTVEIKLAKPYAPFLYMIASQVYIVPKRLWEAYGIDTEEKMAAFGNPTPIGSGPFRLVDRKFQQYTKLEANPYYHLGRPLIDGILFVVISNPEAMLLAFEKGEIDVMTWSIPYATIEKVKNIPNVVLHAVTEYGARFMYFNCKRWPMSEVEFRRAVHHVIDLNYVASTIYQGYALPGSLGRLPPFLSPWYNPKIPDKETKYPFNLNLAAQLLDKIGFIDRDGDGWREAPDGRKVKLIIYSPVYDPLRVRWGDIITENLRKIGVNVEHRPLEWTALVAQLKSGDWDMLIIGGLGSLDPDLLYDIFHSKGAWNLGGCSIPELDDLLEKQRFETNVEKRVEIIHKIQEILAEQVPLLNAVHQQFVFAYRVDKFRGWVTGPTMSPDNWFSYMNLYSVELAKPPVEELTTPPKTEIKPIFTPTQSPTPTEIKAATPLREEPRVGPLLLLLIVVAIIGLLVILFVVRRGK